MAEPFMSQISMVGFDFPPKGWAKCDGARLSVSSHGALFSLLGTTYGGDGRDYFLLPDMRGRSPLHGNPHYEPGQAGGVETVRVGFEETPPHRHTAMASSNAGSGRTVNIGPMLGQAAAEVYATPPSSGQLVPINDGSLESVGDHQGHENRQPYTVLNFIIALTGTFPPRS